MVWGAARSADRSARSDRSLQHQLIRAEGGEMSLNLGLQDVREHGRVPARRIVLVDDHRAYALVKIMPVHDTRYDAEFVSHAIRKRPLLAAPHLCERDSEAQRRFGADRRGRGASPFGVAPRFAFEPRENSFDPVTRK